jgi:Icc-related predicted phosphoesterase
VRFVAISDTHCRHHSLHLPAGDVLLHAGDICYKGNKEEVKDFLQWFSQQKFLHKIFIAGNHDFFIESAKVSELATLIPENVIYLNDSGITIDGINIWGSPITPWFFNWAFNRHRGEEIQKHWNLIPADTHVLMTHGPVLGIHDVVINGRHVGCKDLLAKVKEIKPKVHVCGHIHEGYGVKQKFGVKFINASVLNETYELMNGAVVFEASP